MDTEDGRPCGPGARGPQECSDCGRAAELFDTAGRDDSGPDWVLVINDAAAGYPAPGQEEWTG